MLCMEEAKQWVPEMRHQETSLYLGATAGMRLLKYGHPHTNSAPHNKHRAWRFIHGHHMSSSSFHNCACSSHPEPFSPPPCCCNVAPYLKVIAWAANMSLSNPLYMTQCVYYLCAAALIWIMDARQMVQGVFLLVCPQYREQTEFR